MTSYWRLAAIVMPLLTAVSPGAQAFERSGSTLYTGVFHLAPGQVAQLSVGHLGGPGIAPELRERLGKSPIRSSKAPGSGHGAGMLIAHAAIERFGGSVAISPRRSGGTCVRIELPGIRLNTEREEADSGRKRIASR